MLKKLKKLSAEVSKFKSQWKEVGEKLDERALLAKDAAAMLKDFMDELDQYLLDSNRLISSINNTEEFVHLTGEAFHRYHFTKEQVAELETKIIKMPIAKFSNYEISSKFYHLKNEFKDLVNSTHFSCSDETFKADLDKISNKIKEKRDLFLEERNKLNKNIEAFEGLRHELKELFNRLYCHFGDNYNIRNEKDIDILNFHLRLVAIKEIVGVLPHNSIDNKFLKSLRDQALYDQKV